MKCVWSEHRQFAVRQPGRMWMQSPPHRANMIVIIRAKAICDEFWMHMPTTTIAAGRT
jgi:hypothetical protein